MRVSPHQNQTWSFAGKGQQGRNTEPTLGCAGGSCQDQPEPSCAQDRLSKGDRQVTALSAQLSLPSSTADGITLTDLTPPAPAAPRRRCRTGFLISPLNYCRSNCDPGFSPCPPAVSRAGAVTRDQERADNELPWGASRALPPALSLSPCRLPCPPRAPPPGTGCCQALRAVTIVRF